MKTLFSFIWLLRCEWCKAGMIPSCSASSVALWFTCRNKLAVSTKLNEAPKMFAKQLPVAGQWWRSVTLWNYFVCLMSGCKHCRQNCDCVQLVCAMPFFCTRNCALRSKALIKHFFTKQLSEMPPACEVLHHSTSNLAISWCSPHWADWR